MGTVSSKRLYVSLVTLVLGRMMGSDSAMGFLVGKARSADGLAY